MVKQRKLDEAEAFAREAVAMCRKVYAKDHPFITMRVAMLIHVLTLRDKWQEIETILNEAVVNSPSNSGSWSGLGEFNATRGNFTEAVEQFSRAAQLAPNDNDVSLNLTAALISSFQVERYRAYCHQLLERSTNTRESRVAVAAAKASLLLPVDGEDFDRACQLADFAATANEPAWLMAWLHHTKAWADYRRRRFDSAIDWAQRASSSAEAAAACKASAFYIQACCYAQSQRIDSARNAVIEAERITQLGHDKTREEYYPIWRDWVTVDVLRREAAELIEEQSDDKQQKPSGMPKTSQNDNPTTSKNSTPATTPNKND
jgi:tetratricopeptide (TPR) repeat protein